MAVIYLFENTDNVSISAYSLDQADYENNHIEVQKIDSTDYPPAIINLLRNVLSQAGIRVVIEV